MTAVRAAVVGAGHLGRHHARLYAASPAARLVAVADVNPERAREVALPHGAEALADHRQLVGRVDAASVAAPTVEHARIAADLLASGIDVLVEKPVTATLPEADRLIALARERGRVLMVGHTERFNPAVEALMARARGARFIESHRLGSFSRRSVDIDVVLDLMVHDLDIILALVGEEIASLDAVGVGALTDKADIANVRLRFTGGCVANVTASRISAQKIRKLRVWEDRAYFSLDYTEQSVEHWFLDRDDSGVPAIGRRAVPVERDEPLRREIEEFLGAVARRSAPRSTGEEGRRALELALRIAGAIARA